MCPGLRPNRRGVVIEPGVSHTQQFIFSVGQQVYSLKVSDADRHQAPKEDEDADWQEEWFTPAR